LLLFKPLSWGVRVLYTNIELDFINSLKYCRDINQSWHAFLIHIEKLGFDSAFYGKLFSPHTQSQASAYLSSYQETFLDAYDSLNSTHGKIIDTAAQWCFYNDNVLHWNSREHQAIATPENKVIDELSLDFNMEFGLSIPIRSSMAITGFGVCAKGVNKKTYDNEIVINIPTVVNLAHIFHSHINNLNGQDFLSNSRSTMKQLTTYEREIVKGLAAGETLQKISDDRIFKSISSTNKYIKSAKAKLQVTTKTQLVARSFILGLI